MTLHSKPSAGLKKSFAYTFILWLIPVLMCFTANAQYHEPGFYSRLLNNKRVREQLPNQQNIWRLEDSLSQTDIQLNDFNPDLLNDSIEIKYVRVVLQNTLTDGSVRWEKGKPVTTINTVQTLVAGIRFIKNKQWIAITDTNLLAQYLSERNTQLAKRYKKHLRHQHPTAGIVGITIMGSGLMVDGLLLGALHPYFIPVYVAGGIVTAIGFVVYLNNGPPRVFKKIVDDYNRLL